MSGYISIDDARDLVNAYRIRLGRIHLTAQEVLNELDDTLNDWPDDDNDISAKITALEEERDSWKGMYYNFLKSVTISQNPLDRIIEECRRTEAAGDDAGRSANQKDCKRNDPRTDSNGFFKAGR